MSCGDNHLAQSNTLKTSSYKVNQVDLQGDYFYLKGDYFDIKVEKSTILQLTKEKMIQKQLFLKKCWETLNARYLQDFKIPIKILYFQ